jgi:oxalate decarboxylase/phosphoglucose isomerase-like protein (cupin superfamily)
MTLYMDYKSPSVQFSFDVNNSTLFRKDARNYINVLSNKQLNTLENTSLLDIFLSAGNVVEPHYHQNAAELVYCISGAAIVSIINPFTNDLLNFPITPGQVANVPQGWWHYEIASVDNTHLLAIFDAPVPEVILGSDILRLTPANVLAHTYCLNEAAVKQTLAPINDSVFIGPPRDCNPSQVHGSMAGKPQPYPAYTQQPQPNHGQHNPIGYQLPAQQYYYTQPYQSQTY